MPRARTRTGLAGVRRRSTIAVNRPDHRVTFTRRPSTVTDAVLQLRGRRIENRRRELHGDRPAGDAETGSGPRTVPAAGPQLAFGRGDAASTGPTTLPAGGPEATPHQLPRAATVGPFAFAQIDVRTSTGARYVDTRTYRTCRASRA
jgi:hypothetical protein